MAVKLLNGADLNAQKAVNAADPTNPTDLVTLQYLQAFVRGLSWKDEVRAASTGNVTVSSPGTTLDGVTLAANDSVLLKNQSAPAENGIYVWTASGSALTRRADADSATELLSATVSVMEGTTNQNTVWIQTADAPLTVGTTSLAFAQVGGSGAGFTVAGAGLTSTGVQVDVGAGTGIVVAADTVGIDTSLVVRKGAATFGASATTTQAHGAGSADVQVWVRDISTGALEWPDITLDATNITIVYPSAPGASTKRVVWQF